MLNLHYHQALERALEVITKTPGALKKRLQAILGPSVELDVDLDVDSTTVGELLERAECKIAALGSEALPKIFSSLHKKVHCLKVYQSRDASKSGYLKRGELREATEEALEALPFEALDDAHLSSLLAGVSANDDGKINYFDFLVDRLAGILESAEVATTAFKTEDMLVT